MLALGALIVAAVACTARDSRTSGETLMLMPENATGGVGVVRRVDLLVAYHSSVRHDETIRGLVRDRDAARDAGDTAKVAALEAYGSMMQDVAHRQLAGDEPLYTVLLGVQDELRAIMVEHSLGCVVEAGPGVRGTDITDELVAMLPEAR